jgi:putative transposase
MTRHQGLVLRLYPNAGQREFFAKSFGCVRWVYNNGLAHCQQQREAGEKHPTSIDLQKRLPALKQQFPWLAEVDSQALKEACRALDAAFGHFFRRCKNGETPGYPRFKSRHDGRNSFTCTTASTLASRPERAAD